MKKTVRILLLVIAASMLLSLFAGCGEDDKPAETDGGKTEAGQSLPSGTPEKGTGVQMDCCSFTMPDSWTMTDSYGHVKLYPDEDTGKYVDFSAIQLPQDKAAGLDDEIADYMYDSHGKLVPELEVAGMEMSGYSYKFNDITRYSYYGYSEEFAKLLQIEFSDIFPEDETVRKILDTVDLSNGKKSDVKYVAKPLDSGNESKTQSSTSKYTTLDEADAMSKVGIDELHAYERNADTPERLVAVDNHYFNKYLIPYIEKLAETQKVFSKASLDTDWFTVDSAEMAYRATDDLYGNIYKKLAQDALPYMLADPDDILSQLTALFAEYGFTGSKADDVVNKESYIAYLEENLKYDGYDYGVNYQFSTADGKDVIYVGFICPKYNLMGWANKMLYDYEDPKEGQLTFEPFTDAEEYVTQLKELRDRLNKEYYFQDIYITVHNDTLDEKRMEELAYSIFSIMQPYCEDSERLERFNALKGGDVEQNRFRFSEYLEYFVKQDYTQKAIYFPNDGGTYYTDIKDNEVYGTCDSFIDITSSMQTYSDGETIYQFNVNAGGNEPVQTFRVKYKGYQDVMGIYYPLLMPIYYNDALKNGFFEPYVIPEPKQEYAIDFYPDYSDEAYSGAMPYIESGAFSVQSEAEKATALLNNGFGSDTHTEFPGASERKPVDLSGMGYEKNADGNWVRQMQVFSSDVERDELIYDSTGLLIGGWTKYSDGSFRSRDYKTDGNGDAVMSVDKVFSEGGTLTDQSITEYSQGGKTTSHYETTIREGESSYIKTDSETFDSSGNLIERTAYNANGSPKGKLIVSTSEVTSGTVGHSTTETHKVFKRITYDENGNKIAVKEEYIVVTEDETETNNAVQKYLEEHTGVRRR